MTVIQKFFRRKFIDSDETHTELHRVLSTLDLTLLGIGSTLGIGIYVLAGSVAKANAGPAVVISFFVAAFASVLAGLCYAEFGARVPKAGSAYVYSYVCVGEIIAFIVGWNLIMEYIIGVASVAKGYSGYVDSLTSNSAMRHAFESVGVIDVSFLGHYFDFFAFGITIVLTILLMFGVKESSLVNSIFTVLNLIVVVFVIIAGATYAQFSNWTVDPNSAPNCSSSHTSVVEEGEIGDGGFAPFGFAGIMAGAATCFYGFIGFDVIATTGEEAKNPKRAIPISIVVSLLFVFLAYFGISTVMTMMLPYYCQDKDAPLPFAFEYKGFTAGKWIVNIGALLGLATSLLGSMFPMPRVIYAMAKDGLLFKFLAYVHPKFQTPLWATLVGGLLGAIMAGIFNLTSLIDMMSIGTLTAYTLVAVCVLMLRYRKDESGADDTSIDDSIEPITCGAWFSQIFNGNKLKLPTKLSSTYTLWTIVIYCVLCFAFCGTAILGQDNISRKELEVILPLCLIGAALVFILFSLSFQPTSRLHLTFKVPLLPWIPGLSILVNTYLILKLSAPTWIRFSIWLVIGLFIYFYCLCTGRADRVYRENEEEHKNQQRNISKVSIHGIDNPALEYEDEEKPSITKVEKEKGDSMANGTIVSEEKSKIAEIEPSFSDSDKAGLIHDKYQKEAFVPKSPFEDMHTIHEINQNVLKGIKVPPSALILTAEEEKLQSKSALQNYLENESKTPKITTNEPPSEPNPVSPEVLASVWAAHETAQRCLNGENNNNNNDIEKETAEDIVEAIINKAETQANVEHSKDAEKLVDYVLALAQERASQKQSEDDQNSQALPPFVRRMNEKNTHQEKLDQLVNSDNQHYVPALIPDKEKKHHEEVDPNPEALPPFARRLNEKTTHQEKLDQLTQADEKDLIQFTEGTDPLQHVHRSLQDCISNKPQTVQPLVFTPEQRQVILQELSNLTQNLMEGSREIPIIISDSDNEPASQQKEIAPELITAVLVAHDLAQKQLQPDYSLEKFHEAFVQAMENQTEGKSPPLLVSPAVREEAKNFIQKHMSDPNNQLIMEITGDSDTHAPNPEALQAAFLQIQRAHEAAQESLRISPEDVIKQVHEVIQDTLSPSGKALEPILSTRSQRQEIKDITQKLLNIEVNRQNEENVQEQEEQSPPPAPSKEQVEMLLRIHQNAQDCLRIGNADTTDKSPSPGNNPLEIFGHIHQVAQSCLDGKKSPLEPLLVDREIKKEIQNITQKLTRQHEKDALNDKAKVKNSVDPNPIPPHVIRQSVEIMQRLHKNIQESLNNNHGSGDAAAAAPNKESEKKQVIPRFYLPEDDEDEDAGYARLDSFVFTPATPPVESDEGLNGNENPRRKRVGLSPPKFSEEPLYAKVQKKPKPNESRKPKTSVSFKEHPQYLDYEDDANNHDNDDNEDAHDEEEDEEDDEPIKRSLSNRRPTGPFLPQLNKFKFGNNNNLYGSIQDEDEEEEEDEPEEAEEEKNGKSTPNSQSQTAEPAGSESENAKVIEILAVDGEGEAVVTRRRSSQGKVNVGDLISVFEQGKTY